MNLHKLNRSLFLAASAVAIGLLSIDHAGAANQPDRRSTVVHFGDLNTRSPEGIAALYQRIRQAAESVCKPYEMRDLVQLGAARVCFEDAVAKAVTSVNSPSLTAYANGKRGHAAPIVVASRGP